jgi:hypothetical protein
MANIHIRRKKIHKNIENKKRATTHTKAKDFILRQKHPLFGG